MNVAVILCGVGVLCVGMAVCERGTHRGAWVLIMGVMAMMCGLLAVLMGFGVVHP